MCIDRAVAAAPTEYQHYTDYCCSENGRDPGDPTSKHYGRQVELDNAMAWLLDYINRLVSGCAKGTFGDGDGGWLVPKDELLRDYTSYYQRVHRVCPTVLQRCTAMTHFLKNHLDADVFKSDVRRQMPCFDATVVEGEASTRRTVVRCYWFAPADRIYAGIRTGNRMLRVTVRTRGRPSDADE